MTGEKKYNQDDTIFFLGAGFSAPANVPMTFDFVREFEKHLKKKNNGLYDKFIPFLDKLKNSDIRGKPIGEIPDIEFIYEILHRRLDFKDEVILGFFEDYSPIHKTIDEDTANDLIVELKYLIKNKTNVKPEVLEYLNDFRRFFDSNRLVEIYTTNYDNVIEQFCSKFNITFTDGFDLDWKKENFETLDKKVNLFKIHGSIGWYQTFTGKYLKIPIDFEQYCEECLRKKPVLKSGEELDDMIMYPMQKWERPGPLLDLMYFLKQRLLSTNTKIAYSIGYSFRDDYIKMLFIEALKRNQSLHLFIISPSASQTKKRILENEDMTLNLRIIPINSYLEDILMNLDLIRARLNEALTLEEKNLVDIRRGSKGVWHDCLNLYINSFHFEKAYSIYENYPYSLDGLNIETVLPIILKLYMGLASLKLEKQADTIKNFLKTVLNVFTDSYVIRSPERIDEQLKFVSLFTVNRRNVNINTVHSCFQNLQYQFHFFKNLCATKLNNTKNAGTDKEQQYWYQIKRTFDFLDLLNHFLEFWAKAVFDKELLDEYYSKLEEIMVMYNIEKPQSYFQEKKAFYEQILEKKLPSDEDRKQIISIEKEYFKLIVSHFLD